MRIRKFRKKLNESSQIDVMAMMRHAIALHEAAEDGTEGFDEFEDEDEDFGDDDMDLEDDEFADDELADDDLGDDMVTITVPRQVADELLAGTEEALDVDNMSDEELVSDEDLADADANIEADAAAEEMLDDEDMAEEDECSQEDEEDDIMEEDEEGFAMQTQGYPTKRTRFTGTYQNQPTVASLVKNAISSYGDAATVADGSPKRTRFTGSYKNEPTIKSRYQNGVRAYQNT